METRNNFDALEIICSMQRNRMLAYLHVKHVDAHWHVCTQYTLS